jgi:hypothetical protein
MGKDIRVWYDDTPDNPGWVARDEATDVTRREDIPLDETSPEAVTEAVREAADYFGVTPEDVTVE